MRRIVLPTEPTRDALVLTDIMQAFSDPVRIAIVLRLTNEGALPCACFNLDLPKSTQSHHFRVLRESGIISTHRDGKALINTLRREDIEARFPGLLALVIAASPAPSGYNAV